MRTDGSLLLLSAFFYSVFVGVSEHIYLSFFVPVLLLLFLNFTFKILKTLIFLNFFVILSVFSVVIAKNYELAQIIFLRANLILLFNLLLFANFDSKLVARSLLNLKMGDKMAGLAYFTLKFIGIFKLELRLLFKQLKARGLRHKTNIFTYKTYANLIAMLIIIAIKKQQNMEKTLLARGYKGKILWAQKVEFLPKDIFVCVFAIICAIFKFKEIL